MLTSMMEQTLSKVGQKPQPMMAKASAQSQSKPAAQQTSKSKFDWSSANYHDIFAAAEPTPEPAPAEVTPTICALKEINIIIGICRICIS